MSLNVQLSANGYIDLSDFWWRDGEEPKEQILIIQIFLTLLLFELQPLKVKYRLFWDTLYIFAPGTFSKFSIDFQ